MSTPPSEDNKLDLNVVLPTTKTGPFCTVDCTTGEDGSVKGPDLSDQLTDIFFDASTTAEDMYRRGDRDGDELKASIRKVIDYALISQTDLPRGLRGIKVGTINTIVPENDAVVSEMWLTRQAQSKYADDGFVHPSVNLRLLLPSETIQRAAVGFAYDEHTRAALLEYEINMSQTSETTMKEIAEYIFSQYSIGGMTADKAASTVRTRMNEFLEGEKAVFSVGGVEVTESNVETDKLHETVDTWLGTAGRRRLVAR